MEIRYENTNHINIKLENDPHSMLELVVIRLIQK